MSPSPTCLGCGAEMVGVYCHACGRRIHGEIPTLRDFLVQSAAEALDFGHRLLPTLGTLALRPGKLTRDFISGRGATATHPVRLFIMTGVVAFLATRLYPGFLFAISLGPVSAGVGEQWAVWALLLLAVPITGAVLRVLFFRHRVRYLAHLVFSVHVFSFLMLLSAAESIVGVLVRATPTTDWVPRVLAAVVGFTYAVIAIRSFYEVGWWTAFTRSLAVFLVYLMALGYLVAGVVLG